MADRAVLSLRKGVFFYKPDAALADIEARLAEDNVLVVLRSGTYKGNVTITGNGVLLFGELWTQRAVDVDGFITANGEEVVYPRPGPSGPPWPTRIYRARSPAGRRAPRSCAAPESAVAITPRARRDNGRQVATRAEELSGSRLTTAWSTTTTAESSAAHEHPRIHVPMDR